MKDSVLKAAVIDAIAFEPSIDDNGIGVAVEDGIVTLTGHVPTYTQKWAIEQAVGALKGVRGIAEEIEVRVGSSGTDDDEIAKRVVNSLKWSTMVPDGKVQAMVQNGWVTLTGNLDWHYQRIGAEAAIRSLNGVTGISNHVELNPRVSTLDVKKHIEGALQRNATLEAQDILIDVTGNTVTLRGSVTAWNERRAVEQAVWATPGVTQVLDCLTVL